MKKKNKGNMRYRKKKREGETLRWRNKERMEKREKRMKGKSEQRKQ